MKKASLVLIAMCNIAYAVQPISDEYLAAMVSENTLILSDNVMNSRFIVEQDIALREMPAYQSVNLINQLFPMNFERVVGEQLGSLTYNFGSENFRYIWAGNIEDIWDFNQYYTIFFNQSMGEYELSNVRGRVWVEVETYR